MADYEDENDNYSVQMIPKPGAAPMGRQTEADQQRVQSMRPTLSQSDKEVAGAKQGWEEALRRNVGVPIEQTISALTGAASAQPERIKSALPSQEAGRLSGADMQPGQDIYEQIMQQRQRMLEQGQDPNAPEQMQKFQKIREALLKKGGA